MSRFDDAQVGDLIYCRMNGDGTITSTTYSANFPLKCEFVNHNGYHIYTLDGKNYNYHTEPTLFYRKCENRYLTERPQKEIEKEINWKEWEGKYIEVREIECQEWTSLRLYKYQPEFKLKFACFPASDLHRDCVLQYQYARIIKEPEIDWSKVPEGTKVKIVDHQNCTEHDIIDLFMGYFPNLQYPFWVFDDVNKESAYGYKFCKLVGEPKLEWLKKD